MMTGSLVVVAGILVVAWLGWSAHRLHGDLRTAHHEAEVVKLSLARGDVTTARAAFDRFLDASESAADRTDGAGWGLLERVPVLGDDARGLAAVSRVLMDLADSGLRPVLDSADALTAGAFAPRDHTFPLGRIAAARPPIEEAAAAFAAGSDDLDGVDADGYVGPLRKAFEQLRDEVRSGATILDVMRRAAVVMPQLLGDEGPRNFLLVFQNNAEARAGGGLPGTMSVIHAEEGRVDITRQESAGPFGALESPVLPLTRAEQELYGDPLGTYFTDGNFTPHHPRAADLWRARWRVETGTDIDGVFVVDPVAMSYLLEATGPIRVGGRTLLPHTIVHEVEHLSYLRLNQAEQDEFFNAVADAVFDVFAEGRGDSAEVVRGLVRSVEERRIRVHAFRREVQQELDGSLITGSVDSEPTETPHVGVFLNSGSASKLSYFLDYDVQVTSTQCDRGRQRLIAHMRITAATPPRVEALPDTVLGFFLDPDERGKQLVVVDLFGPVAGTIGDLKFDGRELRRPALVNYLGRPVLSIGLPMDPGQTRNVTWTMTTGPGQVEPANVTVTPGSRPENESSVAPTTCASR